MGVAAESERDRDSKAPPVLLLAAVASVFLASFPVFAQNLPGQGSRIGPIQRGPDGSIVPAEPLNTAPGAAPRGGPAPSGRAPLLSSGSGFFVSAAGDVLTNAHVVNRCGAVSVTVDLATHPGSVAALDQAADLALVRTGLKPPEIASFRRRPARLAEPIAAAGFPLAGILSAGVKVTTGTVNALAGLRDDRRLLQISAEVQPGNSGGPLFDTNGAVLGVIVSKLDSLAASRVLGDIPQNVNFAVAGQSAITFLQSQHVKIVFSDAMPVNTDSLMQAAERAQEFTVKVNCVRRN